MTGTASERDLPEGRKERNTQRKPALLDARLAVADGQTSLKCIIRNFSTAGARILISASTNIPKTFYLVSLKHQTAFRSTLVWRSATQAGIRFDEVLPLADIKDPALGFLKNIYANACLR